LPILFIIETFLYVDSSECNVVIIIQAPIGGETGVPEVEVLLTHLIGEVKQGVCGTFSLELSTVALMYGGEVSDDSTTLAQLGIREFAQLALMPYDIIGGCPPDISGGKGILYSEIISNKNLRNAILNAGHFSKEDLRNSLSKSAKDQISVLFDEVVKSLVDDGLLEEVYPDEYVRCLLGAFHQHPSFEQE
jgi:hypothetical protein